MSSKMLIVLSGEMQLQATLHLKYNHLDLEVVDTSSLYLIDLETGMEVSLSRQEVEEGVMLISQESEKEEISVFQCPAMTKGRQCPDLHMDINTLRVHWSTQHPSNGLTEFQPLELNINSVQHIQCSVPGCHFRHLSTNTVRSHWELEHKDHPERFRVIQHTVNKTQLGAQGEVSVCGFSMLELLSFYFSGDNRRKEEAQFIRF